MLVASKGIEFIYFIDEYSKVFDLIFNEKSVLDGKLHYNTEGVSKFQSSYQIVHCRGGLNPPVCIKQLIFGQIESSPTAK